MIFIYSLKSCEGSETDGQGTFLHLFLRIQRMAACENTFFWFILSASWTGGLHHWGPSPIFVVDNHIYQHAQRSGELGWIRRQLHSWRATSLPFDLFTRFLSGLHLFLPIVITLTLLQTHVLLHLLRGSDLSCVRLQAEGATVGTWNRFTETKVTLNVCTETPPF